MNCPKCGTDVGSAKYCPNCGTAINEAAAPQQSNVPPISPSPTYQSMPPQTPPKKKGGCLKIGLIVLGVIVVIGVIGALASGDEDDSHVSSNSNSSISDSSLQSDLSSVIEPDPSTAQDVSYIELYQQKDAYEGKFVRIAGKIDSSGKNILGVNYITIKEGLSDGLTDELYLNLKDSSSLSYTDGDYIIAIGTVGSSAIGTLNLDDCIIEAVGESAESKAMELNNFETKDEYIASCAEYGYKDISRQPDSYKGKRAKFKGKVIQVLEGYGDNIAMRVDVTQDDYGLWSDTIYVNYTRKSDDEPRILEDDIIIMYGELDGIETYTTVLGSSMSIPRIAAEYISLQAE